MGAGIRIGSRLSAIARDIRHRLFLGVLHHTGSMWEALENVKPLTKMDGQLFIAIYNELGSVTDEWLKIKRRYNHYPPHF